MLEYIQAAGMSLISYDCSISASVKKLSVLQDDTLPAI